jgi:4-amino-4-deoxy-L-arabinose transferase-like glycosyltransferase
VKSSSPDAAGRRPLTGASDEVFAVFLFVLAFVLRFAVAQWLAGEPVWDGHYYDFGARRIAEGHGYSDDRVVGDVVEWHPWCHYPVGYSAYLAVFYRLFGVHAWAAHLANGLSGALVAVVVFGLARETLSRPRARLAALLTALHPGLVLYGALVMGEVLAALSTMAALWTCVWVARRWGAGRGIVAGALLLGVAALIRPQALLCAPFLALVSLGRARVDWKRMMGHAALACVVALVPVLPWTARNCRVMDGCALVSTNAGWNLAIGAFPRATGRFETLRSADGCREVTGQVQQDRCWLSYGIANIRATPGRWLGLIPAKLSNTFDHESFAVEYLREARPSDWPEGRRVAWRTAITAFHRLLVVASPLAFIAFVLPNRRKLERTSRLQTGLLASAAVAALVATEADTPTFWPIVLVACVLPWLPLRGRPPVSVPLLLAISLVATTALTHAVFFGDDRYHGVVTPALGLLAAAALRAPDTRAARTPVGVRAAGPSS